MCWSYAFTGYFTTSTTCGLWLVFSFYIVGPKSRPSRSSSLWMTFTPTGQFWPNTGMSPKSPSWLPSQRQILEQKNFLLSLFSRPELHNWTDRASVASKQVIVFIPGQLRLGSYRASQQTDFITPDHTNRGLWLQVCFSPGHDDPGPVSGDETRGPVRLGSGVRTPLSWPGVLCTGWDTHTGDSFYGQLWSLAQASWATSRLLFIHLCFFSQC